MKKESIKELRKIAKSLSQCYLPDNKDNYPGYIPKWLITEIGVNNDLIRYMAKKILNIISND